MLCDKCKKREAKMYYTEIINGVKKEQHLCEECVADSSSFPLDYAGFGKELSLGGLLSSILGNYHTEQPTRKEDTMPFLTCESCGMTYEEFLHKGKFGCADCYKSFEPGLEKSIRQIQGADFHVGKKPNGFEAETAQPVNELSQVEKLSIRLQDAIEKEEFEEAAKLRDEIKRIKEEGEKEGIGHA